MSSLAVVLQIFLLVTGLFLVIIILLQRGRGGGLAGAFGGMGGQSAFGTKAGDVFTWITVGCATAWVLLAGFGGMAMRKSQDEYAKKTFASGKSDSEKEGAGAVAPNTDGDLGLPEGDIFKPESGSTTTSPAKEETSDTKPGTDTAAPPVMEKEPAAEEKPAAETKPAEDKPATDKPAEAKPAEDAKPATTEEPAIPAETPATETPTSDTPAPDAKPEEKPAVEEKPAGEEAPAE